MSPGHSACVMQRLNSSRDGIGAAHEHVLTIIHVLALEIDAGFDSLDCEEVPYGPGNLSEVHCQIQDEAPSSTTKDVASNMLQTPTDEHEAHHLWNILERKSEQHVIHYLRCVSTLGDHVRENHPNHHLEEE